MVNLFFKPRFSDRIFLTYLCFGFLTLFLHRALFFFVYSYRLEEINHLLILKAFLIGFRFDLVTVSIALVGFYILSISEFLSRNQLYRNLWLVTPLIIYPFCVLHLFADLLYFEKINMLNAL